MKFKIFMYLYFLNSFIELPSPVILEHFYHSRKKLHIHEHISCHLPFHCAPTPTTPRQPPKLHSVCTDLPIWDISWKRNNHDPWPRVRAWIQPLANGYTQCSQSLPEHPYASPQKPVTVLCPFSPAPQPEALPYLVYQLLDMFPCDPKGGPSSSLPFERLSQTQVRPGRSPALTLSWVSPVLISTCSLCFSRAGATSALLSTWSPVILPLTLWTLTAEGHFHHITSSLISSPVLS